MGNNFISWSFDATYGIWWIGLMRWRLIVKAPWNKPLFSERYGYAWHMRLPFGWRVASRLAPRIAC